MASSPVIQCGTIVPVLNSFALLLAVIQNIIFYSSVKVTNGVFIITGVQCRGLYCGETVTHRMPYSLYRRRFLTGGVKKQQREQKADFSRLRK